MYYCTNRWHYKNTLNKYVELQTVIKCLRTKPWILIILIFGGGDNMHLITRLLKVQVVIIYTYAFGSDLHWFTFDQFVHSLGIEPVTMTLLEQCFTFFSEEPRRKVYSSVLFHKWAKATLNVPSIHLVHCYTSSEDLRCFLWGTHWSMIHTKSLLSHFSGEQIVPLRATVRLQKTQNMRHMDVYYCTFMVLFCNFWALRIQCTLWKSEHASVFLI